MEDRKHIPNEKFIVKWNQANSTRDAAKSLGIEINSARTRANNLRNILGEDAIIKHPRQTGRRKLKDNAEEIQRLRMVALNSLENKNQN